MNLLDDRTSLKVNIFLKQFKLSHSEIVQILRDGRSSDIGAEKLRGLLKLLPQSEEVRAIAYLSRRPVFHSSCPIALRRYVFINLYVVVILY